MCRHNYRHISVIPLFLLFTLTLNAQFFDSLVFKAGLEWRLSSQDHQPLWLVANRHGTVADRQTDLVPFLRVTNKHVLASSESQNEIGLYDYNDLTLSYGLSVYNNDHFRSTFIEEGYAKLEYKNWSLRAGRFEEIPGEVDKDLSSGSLGVSGNALPIPKAGLAVTDYTNVPFTNGWLQFKGSFAHGWMGDNRYIKNSYYHEATFFVRVGARALKVYLGAEHFAEWGGTRGTEQLNDGLNSFWDAVLVKEANTPGPEDGSHGGDHRGVIDGGVYWENKNLSLRGYIQKPFEGKNDIGFGTKNGLAGISLSLKDKYTGLQKIVFEVINTTNINKNIAGNKLESYYNNSVYKTGWEYQNNIIGTPLFLNRVRGSNYFPGIKPFDWNAPADSIPGNSNIINNRIFAIHMGVLYSIDGNLDSKTMLTYTKNMGSPVYGALFTPAKEQFYCLQQFSYDIDKYNLAVNAGLGFDFGQLSHNDAIGILVGIVWTIPVHQITGNVFNRN